MKRSLLEKERIWSKFFPFRADPFQKGNETNVTELPPLKVYQFPLFGQVHLTARCLHSTHCLIYISSKVYIVAHVAPGVFELVNGMSWFYSNYNRKYLDILLRYTDVIQAQMYGHEHTDSFRILFDNEGKWIMSAFGSFCVPLTVFQLASVAQLDVPSDWRPGGRGFTPAEVGKVLLWRLIMKYFLRPFSPFRWFNKGSCQFLAKDCTILVNRLED